MKSTELIAMFAERAQRLETIYTPEQMQTMHFDAQLRLSVKQVSWLVGVLAREGWDIQTRGRNAGTHGALPDGRGWELAILRNGSGILNFKDAARLQAFYEAERRRMGGK